MQLYDLKIEVTICLLVSHRILLHKNKIRSENGKTKNAQTAEFPEIGNFL